MTMLPSIDCGVHSSCIVIDFSTLFPSTQAGITDVALTIFHSRWLTCSAQKQDECISIYQITSHIELFRIIRTFVLLVPHLPHWRAIIPFVPYYVPQQQQPAISPMHLMHLSLTPQTAIINAFILLPSPLSGPS